MKNRTLALRISFALLAALVAVAAQADDPQDGTPQDGTERRDAKSCRHVIKTGDGANHAYTMTMGRNGYLGVELTSLTPELRRHFGAPDERGVMISRIEDDSPAQGAGLQVGDIVTRIDEEEVESSRGLGRLIRRKDGGEVVAIEYLRGGELYDTSVTLGERERCAYDIGSFIPEDFDFQFDLDGFNFEGIDFGAIGAISAEAVEEAMKGVRATLESQDWEKFAQEWKEHAEHWKEHGERLQEIDMEGLEKRMEKLRVRMEELEREIEREVERAVPDDDSL